MMKNIRTLKKIKVKFQTNKRLFKKNLLYSFKNDKIKNEIEKKIILEEGKWFKLFENIWVIKIDKKLIKDKSNSNYNRSIIICFFS
jgi:hypothetical protein